MSAALLVDQLRGARRGGLGSRRLLLSANAVRVRNALLLRRGRRAISTGRRSATPPGFRVERLPVPKVIADAVAAAGIRDVAGDWPRALALVGMLAPQRARRGSDPGRSRHHLSRHCRRRRLLRRFRARVHRRPARRAELFCRQWAFSFDGFGGHGHTVVEVYDRQRARWSFLDVHNNVFAVRTGEHEPRAAMRFARHCSRHRSRSSSDRRGRGGSAIRMRASCSTTTDAGPRSGTCGSATTW